MIIMGIIDEINNYVHQINATLKEKKGLFTLSCVVAQRKVFLSKKTLEYIAQFRINEQTREFKFTEMLKESGSGIDGGSGFKVETYNTFKKPRDGTIHEQSELFGKSYTYEFDFRNIRNKIEEIAQKFGYKFEYQITAKGL
jgi:hypothetical protein